MVGSFLGCCPRAASGHTAALPSVTTNSRRWMWVAIDPPVGACLCNGGDDITLYRRDEQCFLRCESLELPMSHLGHVWTAPAVQEESDYQRSVQIGRAHV